METPGFDPSNGNSPPDAIPIIWQLEKELEIELDEALRLHSQKEAVLQAELTETKMQVRAARG